MTPLRDLALILPPDPFWLIRVQVPHDGDCVPYHLMLLWHWQFLTVKEMSA